MPPAGADLETWVPEEEPQPIGVTITMPSGSILPGTEVQAGCWDAKARLWSTEGIGPLNNGDSAGVINFQTKCVGCLAVLMKRTALLPYREWHLRPIGDRAGSEAIVFVQTGRDRQHSMLYFHAGAHHHMQQE